MVLITDICVQQHAAFTSARCLRYPCTCQGITVGVKLRPRHVSSDTRTPVSHSQHNARRALPALRILGQTPDAVQRSFGVARLVHGLEGKQNYIDVSLEILSKSDGTTTRLNLAEGR